MIHAFLSTSKTGAGNCCVRAAADPALSPVGPAKMLAPSSCIALRLTSANRTFSITWLVTTALGLAQHVDDVLRLVDVAGGQRLRAVDDVLRRDDARQHDVLAVDGDGDRLVRELPANLPFERRQVAAHDHFVVRDAAVVAPHQQRDRSRRFAVHEKLARRRDHRVGDLRRRERHPLDRAVGMDDGRSADEQQNLLGAGDTRCTRRPQHAAELNAGGITMRTKIASLRRVFIISSYPTVTCCRLSPRMISTVGAGVHESRCGSCSPATVGRRATGAGLC